jgi:hypothetical protein
MSTPLSLTTQTFENDQQHHFEAYYWPTASTAVRVPGPSNADYKAFGTGIEFALFDVIDSSLVLDNREAIELALRSNSGKTGAVLGYDQSGAYRTGVVPVVYEYWGAGAPTGGSRAKQVLMKYTGVIQRTTAPSTLVFCGQGSVYAIVTRAGSNAVQLIASGSIHEPVISPDLNSISYSTLRSELGYVLNESPITFNAGDKVEIYYLHNGEPWGGFAAKVIQGGADLTSTNFLDQVRRAPVLATSFMAKETAMLDAQPLRYVQDAQVKVTTNAVREMQLTVALSSQDDPTGYTFQIVRDEMLLVDNADDAIRIRKGRIVHLEGGFVSPTTGQPEVYPRFTGYIDDLFPTGDGTACTIQCRGFEGRLTEVFDDNQPDKLAYHAFGYTLREGSAEPVFGIPAFDQWPMETAITTLCYKAGIDPFNLGMDATATTTEYGRWMHRMSDNSVFVGHPYMYARTLAAPAIPVYMERQSNYGNVPPIYKDYLPKDDPYLFPPQVTQRLYDRAKTLSDHYGYDLYFNAGGQLVLTGRNNPMYFQFLTKSGPYSTNSTASQVVNTSAVGGVTYEREHTGGAWSKVIAGRFSRLDLYAGIGLTKEGLNGGRIQVTTERWTGAAWAQVSTNTITTVANVRESFFYDSVLRRDGTNAAVFTILQRPIDQYRVTLTPLGPETGGNCSYRLNGVAVFERDPDQTPLVWNGEQQALTTLGNLTEITPESNNKDMRNHVVVVGARKATITDSDKVANDANPNNQEFEFHVSIGVDPFSIYDPSAANYSGSKRMSVIFDEKVNDSDMARWLTRTILYRYRVPKTSARFKHTPLPTLEIRDALQVQEERNRSVYHKLWVSEYTETWSNADAYVQITGVANPEIPSYQPREDVDVDALFDHNGDGRGEVAIGMDIGYKNIFGQPVDNTALSIATTIKGYSENIPRPSTLVAEAISSGTSMACTQSAIPETMWLSWNWRPGTEVPVIGGPGEFPYRKARALVNNPYRHFYHITGWTDQRPNVLFTFQEGDGTPGVYDKTYYEFPTSANGQWYLIYDRLTPRPHINPYYDPYTSEIGNLVRVNFKLLVSGRVRVSVWDATRANGQEVPVAWLTRPTEAGDNPDAHYVFMDAGDKEFYWDGVDNIGFWNTLQSVDYADETKGAFGERPNGVGKGFYAWNDKSTPLSTRIGDLNSANFDQNGAPMFTMGQYAQFYIKVEVLNDTLVRRDSRRGIFSPRELNSDELPQAGTWHTTDQTYVWSHLPEPSQVGIRVQEWTSGTPWTAQSPRNEANWSAIGSTPDSQAAIRAGKPIRLTFYPHARKGVMFMKPNPVNQNQLLPDNDKTSVKLTRMAHLKATIFDQFWYFTGKPFSGLAANLGQGNAEQKRLVNRMFHNDDNTVEWEDSNWRSGEDVKNYEWIFDPTTFQKDFTGSGVESIRYGDYQQIEALPGFDVRRQGGAANSARSYLNMAYINYLFYFSAFSMDRSGRRQWCLNSWFDASGNLRGFIDKNKIVTPQWRAAVDTNANDKYRIVQYETRGAERYLKRSIFVRQWLEPGWANGSMAQSPVAQFGISNPTQLKWIQPLVSNFDLSTGYFAGGQTDRFLQQYQNPTSGANLDILRMSPTRKNGSAVMDSLPTNVAVTALGSWGFTNPTIDGTWFTPSPCRDFMPYWRFPYMPDWATNRTNNYTSAHSGSRLSILEATGSQINYALRDVGAQENWYGFAYKTGVVTHEAPRVEKTVEEALGEDQSKFARKLTMHATAMYDYVKQDQLDRWDQFRGIRSRGTYAERSKEDASYSSPDKQRSSGMQPVLPAGVYLINLGKYSDYTVAKVHAGSGEGAWAYIHMVDAVTNWFNISFLHEYVWYGERFFPVSPGGGPLYAYTRTEYTQVASAIGEPWWASVQTFDKIDVNHLGFDPGAWTGWKPDADDWSSQPYLRWRDVRPMSINSTTSGVHDFARGSSGGYGGAFASTGLAEAVAPWGAVSSVFSGRFRRENLFDDNLSSIRHMRLAVGPTVETARPITMNLTLPKRLMGL